MSNLNFSLCSNQQNSFRKIAIQSNEKMARSATQTQHTHTFLSVRRRPFIHSIIMEINLNPSEIILFDANILWWQSVCVCVCDACNINTLLIFH